MAAVKVVFIHWLQAISRHQKKPLLLFDHLKSNGIVALVTQPHPSSTKFFGQIIYLALRFCMSSVCDACQRAKSHQLPYSLSNHVSLSPLELVFSDVWGPSSISANGNKYYLNFINDFSKFTWVYPLKNKADVYRIFMQFQNHVERLLGEKIVCMQTDWGGEYQNLHTFFQTVGITHHVSCPYTHQQNGSAKRKHCHIVEVDLSLLAHASMPLKFRDEAFHTACFLINRFPSKVMQCFTPMERLLHAKPDYSFMKVFCCACWPYLWPYNKRKIQFCSQRCLFLGYSSIHKGYKCLLPSTNRIYISRDAIFNENVFPFSQIYPSADHHF